ncbi:MAG: YfhO family protein [Coriobacteriales bacterium]|nr:YfhO family protein [Coriobacteriales bacterium]
MSQYVHRVLNAVHALGSFDLTGLSLDNLAATNIANELSEVLLNPFYLPVVLLGLLCGGDVVPFALMICIVVPPFVCGHLCYYYLGFFGFSKKSKVVASYLLAFNGFLLICGEHYMFAVLQVAVILILTLMERTLQGNARWFSLPLCLAVAWIIADSLYFSWMIGLFCVFYFALRLWQLSAKHKGRALFRRARAIVLSVLLGVLLSAVVLLPALLFMTDSSTRLSLSGAGILDRLPEWLSLATNLPSMLRLSVSDLAFGGVNATVGSGTNMFEVGKLFFSSLIWVFCGQYVAGIFATGFAKGVRRIQCAKLLAVALLCVLLCTDLGAAAMNFFQYPMFRWTGVVMPVFAIVVCGVLDPLFARRRLSLPVLVVSLAVTVILLLMDVQTSRVNAVPLLMVVLFVVVVLIYSRRACSETTRRGLTIAMVALLFANVTADAFLVKNLNRGFMTTEQATAYSRQIDTSYDYGNRQQSDKDVYRIEFLRDSSFASLYTLDLPKGADYYGLSWYDTLHNKYTHSLLEDYCPGTDSILPGTYHYIDMAHDARLNETIANIVGLKYLIASNVRASEIPAGFVPVAVPSSNDPGEGSDGLASTEQDDDVENTVYLNENYRSFVSFYSLAVPFSEFKPASREQKDTILQQAIVIDEQDGYDTALTSLEQASNQRAQGQGGAGDLLTGEPADISALSRDKNVLSFSVDASKPGYAFAPLPYTKGWSATVNGEPIEILRVDSLFMALPVAAGYNECVLRFDVPLQKEGAVASALAVVLILALTILERKTRHRALGHSTDV